MSPARLILGLLLIIYSCLSVCSAADGSLSANETKRLNAVEVKVNQQGVTLGEHGSKLGGLSDRVDTTMQKVSAAEAVVKQTQSDMKATTQKVEELKTNAGVTRRDLDRFWVLLAAVLVFFMQAGFKCLEVGMSRRRHAATMGVMNLMNWLIVCLVFYCWGFGLMFGHSFQGIIGTSLIFPSAEQVEAAYQPLGLEFLLFQLAFAATTATIVDGALAERTALLPYALATCLASSLIYPVFGHWAWNSAGWLENLGGYKFHDFAGSTVVHSVGAWISLIGVHWVGPRRFRFTSGSTANLAPYNMGYAVLGVIMLWFGWWGFNGGSTLKYNDQIASIILHTNLAGAAAGVTAYFHALATGGRATYEKIIGGVLGGLVAITACCDVVNPLAALIVGATAGVIHNLAFEWLSNRQVDDVAGAIPVHGACGVWGTLCAGFAMWWLKGAGPIQVLVQFAGIVAAFVYTCVVAYAIFGLVERLIGLRTSIVEEDGGRADSLLGVYEGGLRVTVLRRRLYWTRFTTFQEHMRWVQRSDPAPRQARQEVVSAMRSGKSQFIRDDDTEATEEDVAAELDRFFS